MYKKNRIYFFSSKKKRIENIQKEKSKNRRKKNTSFYGFIEFILCVIDEPDICGLSERRGTSC